MEVYINLHKEYIEVIVAGDYSLQEAVDNFLRVLGAVHTTGLSKVLIDYRQLKGEIFAVQEILYAHQVVAQIKAYYAAGGKNLSLAYVGDSRYVSAYQPGLRIAEIEGIKALTTDNIEKACEWLDLDT